MSDSPESVVREFLAAWADPKADELASSQIEAAGYKAPTPASGSRASADVEWETRA